MVGEEHLCVLRRDQPDRAGRIDRHVEGVPRLALGPQCLGAARRRGADAVAGCGGRSDRRRPGRRRLPELPDDQGRVRRVLRGARRGRIGDRSRLRQRQVLRGLPADRGDGASRARHAALRADEAGRPRPIRAPAGCPTRWCSCGRTRSPAITTAWWASRRRSNGAIRRACCKMIPGLENAEFVRFGMVHRNTYICGPKVLLPTWQTRHRADLFFAGQVSGVEGYVESAASGLIAGRNAAALAKGEAPQAPPRTTAIGALAYYVSHADPEDLSADQHHARHHAAARQPAARQDEEENDDCRARACRSGRLAPADARVGNCRRTQAAESVTTNLWLRRARPLEGLSRLPQAESPRLAAHRARLRQRRHAVPRVASPARPARKCPSWTRTTSIWPRCDPTSPS